MSITATPTQTQATNYVQRFPQFQQAGPAQENNFTQRRDTLEHTDTLELRPGDYEIPDFDIGGIDFGKYFQDDLQSLADRTVSAYASANSDYGRHMAIEDFANEIGEQVQFNDLLYRPFPTFKHSQEDLTNLRNQLQQEVDSLRYVKRPKTEKEMVQMEAKNAMIDALDREINMRNLHVDPSNPFDDILLTNH